MRLAAAALILLSCLVRAEDDPDALAAKAAALAAEQKVEAAQKAQLEAEVKRLESRIERLKKNLAENQRRVDEQEGRVAQLQSERAAKAQDVTQLQQSLTTELRAFYKAGPEARLDLAGKQSGPRLVEYLRFLTQARRERLDQLKVEQKRLASAERRLQKERDDLTRDLTALNDEQRRLAETTNRQSAMLSKLDRSLDTRAKRQAAIEADRQRLTQVLNNIKPSAVGGQPFAQSKGKMDWPTTGRVLRGFGQKRSDGQSNWTGMVIGADPGAEVRAVQDGKVAYAGWLLGYGLLLVVEHDNGYATLYGHNQTLEKERGDRISAGELIGRAGATGSLCSSGAFFGVNREGRPLDPISWLKKRG